MTYQRKDRTCKFCYQIIPNSTPGELGGHVQWCKFNPKAKEYRIVTRKNIEEKHRKEKGKYKSFEVGCYMCHRIFYVEEREKEFPKKEKYFCSKFCSRSYSTKNDNKKEKKLANCIFCEKEMEVNKRTSSKKVICEDCKKKNEKCKYKKCKCCGNLYECKIPEYCKLKRKLVTIEKYFGFDKSKMGSHEYYNEIERIREYIYDLYHNKNFSVLDIEKEIGINNYTLILLMEKLKIPRRSLSESIKNTIYYYGISGASYNYMTGYHVTWNNKRIYYRSSYELDYAKYLDNQEIDYETESVRIKYWDNQFKNERIAIPDFYLPEYNLIVEIKSTYTLDIKNMLDKAKQYLKQGYNFQLICEGRDLTNEIIYSN